jgi:hypothetical protein
MIRRAATSAFHVALLRPAWLIPWLVGRVLGTAEAVYDSGDDCGQRVGCWANFSCRCWPRTSRWGPCLAGRDGTGGGGDSFRKPEPDQRRVWVDASTRATMSSGGNVRMRLETPLSDMHACRTLGGRQGPDVGRSMRMHTRTVILSSASSSSCSSRYASANHVNSRMPTSGSYGFWERQARGQCGSITSPLALCVPTFWYSSEQSESQPGTRRAHAGTCRKTRG